MLYFTDLPAIKFSVAAEKLTHRLVPLPALSDAPGHAPNPPSCRPRPCQGFRQRQGGDAEGGGPIPSGAESVRPRAPTAPAGLGEERGFWSLSRPTRGRSTRPRPYGEVPIPFSLLHLQPRSFCHPIPPHIIRDISRGFRNPSTRFRTVLDFSPRWGPGRGLWGRLPSRCGPGSTPIPEPP
jgi:hypothetical protein